MKKTIIVKKGNNTFWDEYECYSVVTRNGKKHLRLMKYRARHYFKSCAEVMDNMEKQVF